MPRQPLKYVYPDAKVLFPANALEQRPQFAQLVAECIGFWSQVEAQTAILLAAIMKTDTATAAAVFLSIRNSRAQRDAISAAAEASMTGRELEMFRAIVIVYQALDAQRADLVHGIFGVAPGLTDILLWVDSKDYAKYWIEGDWKENALQRSFATAIKQATFIYRDSDLTSLREEIKNLWEAAFRFSIYLKHQQHINLVPEVEQEFQRLYILPPIQRALDRLREGSKNKP